MQKLEELIAALEKAEGQSRELDCAIAVTVDGYYEIPPKWEGGPVGYGYVEDDGKRYVQPGHGGDQLVPRYTTSIDAAVALVERVLPESSVLMGWSQTPQTLPWARIGPWFAPDATGANQAIALCIATLRALSSQEQRK